MSKKVKNKKKNQKKDKQSYSFKNDLLGILFIFLAIFGSGASAISEGLIPGWLEDFFRFFFGIWYFVAAITLFVLGVFLIVKKRFPNYLDKRLIGTYLVFIGVLLITHTQVFESYLIKDSDSSILRLTWESFLNYLENNEAASSLGGGFIGGILFVFNYYLFSSIGAKIIAVFSMIIGGLFITNVSLDKVVLFLWKKTKKAFRWLREKWELRRQKREFQKTETESELEINPSVEEDSLDDREEESAEISYADPVESESDGEDTEEELNEDVEEDYDSPIKGNPVYGEENDDYKLPPMNLLAEPKNKIRRQNKSHIQATVRKLEKTFESFGVQAKVTKVHVGPAVTKFEINPAAGVKVNRIVSLHDDLALALAAQDLRIEAPIPGKSAVGIEVPNDDVTMVSMREVLEATMDHPSKLLFALGRDISGNAVAGELDNMPHLLIAGATGSGKSVCINGIITTILMRAKPHEVKMMMIDPKKVELNIYNGIPHLLSPVVTDPKKAAQALRKVVSEMDRRYELFSKSGARNIRGYNESVAVHNQESENKIPKLPYIVVIVDELSDLMSAASKDVENSIIRLAQMARAAGIHLIIATQRPSVDVITGIIKANIPSRIAFSVSSQVDSRTILDMGGAEKLLGRGDMLYIPVGQSKPMRVQGAFLSDEEVERIASYCKEQQEVVYQEEMIPEEEPEQGDEDPEDELFNEAVEFVIQQQRASVSMLQTKFRIGYNRAARLIDAMETKNIIGPFAGSKPREVLIKRNIDDES